MTYSFCYCAWVLNEESSEHHTVKCYHLLSALETESTTLKIKINLGANPGCSVEIKTNRGLRSCGSCAVVLITVVSKLPTAVVRNPAGKTTPGGLMLFQHRAVLHQCQQLQHLSLQTATATCATMDSAETTALKQRSCSRGRESSHTVAVCSPSPPPPSW